MAVILIFAIRESFLGYASVAQSVRTTYIAMLGDVAEFVWVQILPRNINKLWLSPVWL